MNAYKKEVWFTAIMSILFLISGHMGFLFTIFPVSGNLFGFPVSYIVPILMGWFGVLALTLIAGHFGNKIDKAIEDENNMNAKNTESSKESKGVI